MTIRVFVQNEAGSFLKHYHNEKTLEHLRVGTVAHAYPYPYGFIIATTAEDQGNVDCFVITSRPLAGGEIVECEMVGLMEQFEDGVPDHNVLAAIAGEDVEIDAAVRDALVEHVLACFADRPEKKMRVGRFLGASDAAAHVSARIDESPSPGQD